MRHPRLSALRFWIAAGLALSVLASALVVVSINEKAQRFGRWLPRVTIDRKARKITLGINLTPAFKGPVLPEAKPITDDIKLIKLPPALQ